MTTILDAEAQYLRAYALSALRFEPETYPSKQEEMPPYFKDYDFKSLEQLHKAHVTAVHTFLNTSGVFEVLRDIFSIETRWGHSRPMVYLVYPTPHFTHAYPLNRFLALLVDGCHRKHWNQPMEETFESPRRFLLWHGYSLDAVHCLHTIQPQLPCLGQPHRAFLTRKAPHSSTTDLTPNMDITHAIVRNGITPPKLVMHSNSKNNDPEQQRISAPVQRQIFPFHLNITL